MSNISDSFLWEIKINDQCQMSQWIQNAIHLFPQIFHLSTGLNHSILFNIESYVKMICQSQKIKMKKIAISPNVTIAYQHVIEVREMPNHLEIYFNCSSLQDEQLKYFFKWLGVSRSASIHNE